MALGDQRTCARTRDGAVSCWGRNDHGQLGDGTTTERTTPTRVAGRPAAAQLTAGFVHTCARTDDASVWCWGGNANGEIGPRALRAESLAPVRVWP